MRRRKAAKPATAGTANRLHAKRVCAGRQNHRDASKAFDPTTQPGFLAVYDGQVCLGHLLLRGKAGVEAYNTDDRFLGVFPNLKAAADAVSASAKEAGRHG
jgi:hypothetical protein